MLATQYADVLMKSFISKIFAISFFSDLVFIYPVYALMFSDSGLNALQISMLLMVWAVTSFVLEVPSGVLADKYSRKNILFLAELARITGYLFWLLMPNFLGFLIGFVLWGVKSAFTSGTFEAIVFDELKANGQERQYTKIQGIIQSLGYLAFIFAGIGASLAISFGYGFVLVISMLSLALSSFAILLLPKSKSIGSTREKEYFKLLKEGLRFSLKTPAILNVIVFIALGQALFGALDEYWSIFANQVGLSKQWLGIFFVIYGLVQAASSLIAYKFEKANNKFFEFLFLANGVLLISAAYFYRVPVLILLFVFSFSFKLIDTVTNSRLQHQISNPNVRATITSVKGFFVELAVIGLYLVFGLIARYASYQSAFFAIGVVISVVGTFYLVFNKHKKICRRL